jgi:hypothetical protein
MDTRSCLRLIIMFFLALVLTSLSSVRQELGRIDDPNFCAIRPDCIRLMAGFPWHYRVADETSMDDDFGLAYYSTGLLLDVPFYGVLLWLLGNALEQGVLLVHQRRWRTVPVLIPVLTCWLAPLLFFFLLVPPAFLGELLFYYTFLWLSATALLQSVLLVPWFRWPPLLRTAPVLTFLMLPPLLFVLLYFPLGPSDAPALWRLMALPALPSPAGQVQVRYLSTGVEHTVDLNEPVLEFAHGYYPYYRPPVTWVVKVNERSIEFETDQSSSFLQQFYSTELTREGWMHRCAFNRPMRSSSEPLTTFNLHSPCTEFQFPAGVELIDIYEGRIRDYRPRVLGVFIFEPGTATDGRRLVQLRELRSVESW